MLFNASLNLTAHRPALPRETTLAPTHTLNTQFNLSLRQSKLYLCGNLCRPICAKSNIKLLSCRQLSFTCRRSLAPSLSNALVLLAACVGLARSKVGNEYFHLRTRRGQNGCLIGALAWLKLYSRQGFLERIYQVNKHTHPLGVLLL